MCSVLVIAFIQGALVALMFWVLGIPSPALWGMVTMLTSVIPLVGSAAVWIPGMIYLIAIGKWLQAIVRPRLVGERVGLGPIFFAVAASIHDVLRDGDPAPIAPLEVEVKDSELPHVETQ